MGLQLLVHLTSNNLSTLAVTLTWAIHILVIFLRYYSVRSRTIHAGQLLTVNFTLLSAYFTKNIVHIVWALRLSIALISSWVDRFQHSQNIFKTLSIILLISLEQVETHTNFNSIRKKCKCSFEYCGANLASVSDMWFWFSPLFRIFQHYG